MKDKEKNRGRKKIYKLRRNFQIKQKEKEQFKEEIFNTQKERKRKKG